MIVNAYDFETTSPVPKECEPLQLAVVKAEIHEDGTYTVLDSTCTLLSFKADTVPAGAYGVHGISKEMTIGSPTPDPTIKQLVKGAVLGYNNRSFDDVISRRYGADIKRSVDLFAATQRLKSEGVITKASLGESFKQLTGREPENAHDALADVFMTLDLIQPIMKYYQFTSFTDFVEWMAMGKADVNMKMPFGKHKGVPLKNLPRSYVLWCKKNLDMSPDLNASMEAL